MLRGYFEAIDYYDGQGWFAKGWASNDEAPDHPVALELWSNAGLLVRFTADRPRPDLVEAGIGNGRCAFELQLPAAVLDGEPHMLHVIASDQRSALGSSPRIFAMPRLRGRLERVDGLTFEGWAKDELDPERPVVLDVLVDGRGCGQIECSAFRRDLPLTLGTSGHNAFRHTLPSSLCDGQPHEVALRFTNAGVLVPGGPVTVALAPVVVPAALAKLEAEIEVLEQSLQEAISKRWRIPLRLIYDRQRYHRWLVHHEAQWQEPPPTAATGTPMFSVVLAGPSGARDLASLADTLSWSHAGWEFPGHGVAPADPQTTTLEGTDTSPAREALPRARGEFVVLLPESYRPHRALLGELYAALEDGAADAAYVDEDSLEESGERHSPHFKPDWDPDRFLATGYVGGVCCVRRAHLIEALGWSRHPEPSWQELIERTLLALPPARIRHIPRVLAHKTAATVESAEKRAARLQDILDDIGWSVWAEPQANGTVRLHWPIPEPAPGITLIIPTRDRVELLRACVESIAERTAYRPYNVLVVDNGSTDPESVAYLADLDRRPGMRVLREPGPFNFSALNNKAIAVADTPLIGLINNDIEVIEPDWLGEMVSHAVRPEVGVVGAKLLYPDGTIQHGGVVVGMHGAADNSQKAFSRDEPGYFQCAVATQQVSAVTAACLVCRREVYEAVGGFDADTFPISFNDVDFCLKLRQEGLLVIWTPYAHLCHHESASRGADSSPQALLREEVEVAHLRKRWQTDTFVDPFYSVNLNMNSDGYLDFCTAIERSPSGAAVAIVSHRAV